MSDEEGAKHPPQGPKSPKSPKSPKKVNFGSEDVILGVRDSMVLRVF